MKFDRRLLAATVAVATSLSLAGCSDDTPPASPAASSARPAPAASDPATGSTSPAAATAAATRPAGTGALDAAGFKALTETPGVIILDVRTPTEFAAGHLAGAQNIDVEAADFATRIAPLDRTAAYAVYCRSGRRSEIAMTMMASAGFTSLRHLDGGIGAWTAAGYPLTT